MTASTARPPTVQSENTITKHGYNFTAVTVSTTRPPTVQSEATNKKHDYNSIKEGVRQISQQLNELLQKIIEFWNITQKVHDPHTDSAKSSDNSPLRGDKSVPVTQQNSPAVENVRYVYDHFAQNFTVQVTDVFQQVQTDSDANSFNDEIPPRGDTSDQNFPAFWHLFLPPKHHKHTPSVKHTEYYDFLKYIYLFLITVRIDDRYGDGWNKILFEDHFGSSWHK